MKYKRKNKEDLKNCGIEIPLTNYNINKYIHKK